MSDAAAPAPFPHMPGEGSRLDSRETVLRGNENPPGYLTIALRALDEGVLPSSPPPRKWLAEFDIAPDSREALRDIAMDFAVFSSSYADGTVAEWKDRKTGEQITTPQAMKRLWAGYAGRLVQELDERKISPRDELRRITTEWAAFRKDRRAFEEREVAARNAHEAAINRDFANQAYWPASSVIYWIYERRPHCFDEDNMVLAELELALQIPSLAQVTELFAVRAKDLLWRECRAGRIKMFGRRNGQGEMVQLSLLELQSGGTYLSEDLEGACLVRTASDVRWSTILFDVADVKRSFLVIGADGAIPTTGDENVDQNLALIEEAKAEAAPSAAWAAMIKAARSYVEAQRGKVFLVDIYEAIAATPGLRMPGKQLKPRIAKRMRELYPDRINASGARRKLTTSDRP